MGLPLTLQFVAIGIKIQGNNPQFTDALVATGNVAHMDRFNAGRTVNFLRILRGTVNFLLVPKGRRFNISTPGARESY